MEKSRILGFLNIYIWKSGDYGILISLLTLVMREQTFNHLSLLRSWQICI